MWTSSSKDSGECSSTCVLMPHLSLGVFLCVVMALFLNFSGEGRQIHVFASGSMLSMRVLRGGGSRILSAEYSGCVACRVCLFLLSKLRTQDSAGVLSPRIVLNGSSPDKRQCAMVCGQQPTKARSPIGQKQGNLWKFMVNGDLELEASFCQLFSQLELCFFRRSEYILKKNLWSHPGSR